jgi:hypothetical protein
MKTMKFVSLLVLVASLSQSSASAQVLIAPTKDRFAVSLRDLNATTPSPDRSGAPLTSYSPTSRTLRVMRNRPTFAAPLSIVHAD